MSRQRARQHAPEAEAERLYHWALLDRIDEKKIELSEWVAMPAASISEIDRKKQGASELRAELAALELQFNVPNQAAVQSPATLAPLLAVVTFDDEAWKTKARELAFKIINRQREKDLYPSQENLGDEIASEFRAAGIVGADGKPLAGATIKRHALTGISSAQGKQLSTRTGRGKWGK